MKTIGDKIFAKDADGRLVSRIGTMFLRTPGLVTAKGVHAMQRMMWLDELSRGGALSPEEEEAELAESVDLIFTEDEVLIRPDPDRMDLAMRADEELQKLVSKRQIRYLNTNAVKVRTALIERGEIWRMARVPISQDDMVELIEKSRTAIGGQHVYYYNPYTGTRYITASGYAEVEMLPPEEFRVLVKEIVQSLSKRNRMGYPEVDLFPLTTPIEIKNAFKALRVDELDDEALKAAVDRIDLDWRMSLPPELREETTSNFEWRNAMCDVITRMPNQTAAQEQELIHGISPEFYRQIEWLPGARIVDGEVIFDAIYDEAARTRDPRLEDLCDNRVKSILFNMTRTLGRLSYVNIGRISRSLARRPVEGNRRGNVYIMQYRCAGDEKPSVFIIRLQKWGVAEHLDEGKDLLQSIIEADEYSDYILDRRLMCRQLGMNLPRRVGFERFTEKYHGRNQYNAVAVRTAYFVREYIPGTASDKVPPARLHNPAFALRFARLMGEAAAVDLVVGRRSSATGEPLFDQNYEVIRFGEDQLPAEVMITDHAGSFVDYEGDYASAVDVYAEVIRRRVRYVSDPAAFAAEYVAAFARRLAEVQQAYRSRRRAFDELFSDRPYDTNGSGAYRWAKALSRLDGCDVAAVAGLLKAAIGC